MLNISNCVSQNIMNKFEFHNFGHALEILTQSCEEEWLHLTNCLENLSFSIDDILKSGGNESPIPKKFDDLLYPCGWREIRITGDLLVKMYPRQQVQRRGRFSDTPFDQKTIVGYIDGHNIDFLKGRIAFDLEWNSKDQTFDRDLLAMRTYYECDVISAGIIITRARELNDVFKTVYDYDKRSNSWKLINRKYGASTTWMGKLMRL